MTREETLNGYGFDLYRADDEFYKNVGTLRQAERLFQTQDDVHELRFYSLDAKLYSQTKTPNIPVITAC